MIYLLKHSTTPDAYATMMTSSQLEAQVQCAEHGYDVATAEEYERAIAHNRAAGMYATGYDAEGKRLGGWPAAKIKQLVDCPGSEAAQQRRATTLARRKVLLAEIGAIAQRRAA